MELLEDDRREGCGAQLSSHMPERWVEPQEPLTTAQGRCEHLNRALGGSVVAIRRDPIWLWLGSGLACPVGWAQQKGSIMLQGRGSGCR